MKIILCLSALSLSGLTGQELKLHRTPEKLELSWKRVFPPSSGVSSQIHSRILASPDLLNWVELSSSTANESLGDGTSSFIINGVDRSGFFMLEESLSFQHRTNTSDQPAVYGIQLDHAAATMRQKSIPDFAGEGDDPACLPSITWDPTTATFWNEFNTSPEDHNALLPPNDPERRLTDFRLDEEELALFMKNGFVVSERIAKKFDNPNDEPNIFSSNPVDYYYKIWTDDLPVFITSDSMLDAWHQTFLGMLEEIEELYLYPSFRKMLVGDLHGKLHESGDLFIFPTTTPALSDLSGLESEWLDSGREGAEHVRQAIADLNVYLGTASRLITRLENPVANPDPATADHWYQAVSVHSNTAKSELYGDGERIEDMTLYKVRGHYVNSEVLASYFQTLIWLSRAQFHIAAETGTPQQNRELRAAVLLALQVRDGGFLPLWEDLEGLIQLLVGQSDAMTVKEMIALLEALSLDQVEDLASDENLNTIREALLASSYGVQEINGGQAAAGGDCEHTTSTLPRALSLFGQRWTPDAWALNQVVVPSVSDDDGGTLHRRMPSGLDVMYSVLGNDAAAPILAGRMEDNEGVPFRDGIPFQDELEGVRSVMDAQHPEFWQEHIYGSWLYSLRALSPALTTTAPETFRTSAWKRRMINTQLASWTQLRHDTLLYAEQSFTPPVACEFPDGYVDPYPEFFERLSEMALRYKDALATLDLSGTVNVSGRNPNPFPVPVGPSFRFLPRWVPEKGFHAEPSPPYPGLNFGISVNLESHHEVIRDHLEHFSQSCLMLSAIAENQLAGNSHTAEMSSFIRDTVELESVEYTGVRRYSGWFPNLYYTSFLQHEGADHPASVWNPVVADVHTDGPDALCTGDPGGVLHEGVGLTQFMLVSVRHPDGSACVFGGPVMSHFEMIKPSGVRLTDGEWKRQLESRDIPQPADWKLDFLVPEPRPE